MHFVELIPLICKIYLGDEDYDEPGPSTATPKNKKLKLPPVPKVNFKGLDRFTWFRCLPSTIIHIQKTVHNSFFVCSLSIFWVKCREEFLRL